MNSSSRRSFIKGSAAAAGVTLAGSAVTLAEDAAIPQALRSLDRAVATILASYSAPRHVAAEGKTARIEVEVDHFDRFVKSFERFTGVSDFVQVRNDNVTFARGGTTYVIENHVV